MSEVVIQVDSLAKRYRLGVLGTGTLGHDLNRWWHRIRGKEDPYTRVGDQPAADPQSAKDSDELWALRNVSFEVNQGDVLAIVGRNGAGKSTLLKILTRVTAPSSGEVRIKGRIASLLEVGTGFHPELTGRENIFLNGTILGMTKAEITRKLDEIVAFAEVDRHLDTPVKRYSSGMYVRLAFAVAAHLEPEILIVDEVLAVGDAEFQKKCLGKMKDVANDGRTILFVSHNLEAVRRLCTRGILIQSGRVTMDSDIEQVAEAYTKTAAINTPKVLQNRLLGLTIFDIKLRNQDGLYGTTFRPGDDLIVELSYEAKTPIPLPFFSIVIMNFKGSCFAANMRLDGFQPQVLSGTSQLSCVFKSVPLLPQSYTVQLAVHASNGRDPIIRYHDVAHFDISGDLAEYGYQGRFMTHTGQSTPVVVPYEWHLPDGTVKSVGLNRLATRAQPLDQ